MTVLVVRFESYLTKLSLLSLNENFDLFIRADPDSTKTTYLYLVLNLLKEPSLESEEPLVHVYVTSTWPGIHSAARHSTKKNLLYTGKSDFAVTDKKKICHKKEKKNKS